METLESTPPALETAPAAIVPDGPSAPRTKPPAMTCVACGFGFDEETAKNTCDSCAAKGGCGLARCPRCGYEQGRLPRPLARLMAWWSGRRRAAAAARAAGSVSATGLAAGLAPDGTAADDEYNTSGACAGSIALSDLRDGESAVVERFRQVGHVRKFLSLGILPGTHLTVLRAKPAVVLRVGYSEFAFDRELAATVEVHRLTLR